MKTREIFRKNLKFYRKSAGLTQEELSEKIGYGHTYITKIESRHKFPKPETIDLIAETLKIEPGQLFEQKHSENNIFISNKAELITDLSNEIYKKLSQDLHERITEEVSKVFS
jgi:transcriptional regulator with XRE-family HTH domain